MTATIDPPVASDAPGAAAIRVAATNAATTHFFATNADLVARACHAMAKRFQKGGRLLVYGQGAQRSDVAHVVVEFVHPVIVGKRALPALALGSPAALATMARDSDTLLLLCAGTPSDSQSELLKDAQRRGMLVLELTGCATVASGDAQSTDMTDATAFHFAVPSHDPLIVQEAHEVLYHVLWELVHVFFEHRAVTA